ncbi:MAG: type II toxin-antitoxin system VapC family toxin [Nitrospirae bacterium]|nr:type II toxin-antitoxin system VapC family toxin [Nitrospirota bacterium]MBI3393720.1 type II toxin-antitoxin system VapC family toxin [Nitrospirota bacterium]
MNVYVDTSVLTAYYSPETHSQRVQTFLLGIPQPAVSWLTETEIASAMARKVREGSLPRTQAVEIWSLFHSHLVEGYFWRLPVASEHYELAASWIASFKIPLRTLDALHLAVAVFERLPLATLDRSLVKAARTIGAKIVEIE